MPPMTRPLPLHALPPPSCRQVRGVMTDIDDTLTADGELDPAALQALQALADAGLPVIAITGRPMGWSQSFARELNRLCRAARHARGAAAPPPGGAGTWPLAAIVAENGAVALIPQGDGLAIEYAQDEATRQANAIRLQAVQQQVLREVPGATAARDSAGRVTDIAIDHSEFAHLDEARIAGVVAIMRAASMHATVSSIHINGWFGEHDKLSGARWMVQRLFGRRLDDEIDRWVYVGDSTNDQAMFAAFALSVGVANLQRFAAQLHTWPAYLCAGERGRGFAELAARLLAERSAAG